MAVQGRDPVPELPEVETVRAGLAAKLLGRRLAHVELRRKDLRVPFPSGFAKRLEGRRLIDAGRRGKYLLLTFDDETVLLAHLGMSGRMVLHQGPPEKPKLHEHVAFRFDDDVSVAFSDPRRFGLMLLTTVAEAPQHPLLAAMGPEPLGPDFHAAYLAEEFSGKRAPLKNALMDQRVVAGLGNIYVCEALYRAGLSPDRAAESVRPRAIAGLVAAVRAVLTDAIAAGGSSLRDYVQASGELGYFQDRWSVYGREGERCPGCKPGARCRVQRVTQGGRSTFFCPRRQR